MGTRSIYVCMELAASGSGWVAQEGLLLVAGCAYIIGMQTFCWESSAVDFCESTGLLVNKLAHMMAQDMHRRLKAYDVTMSQWLVLKFLWAQEGRSQVELQEVLGLDGATVTGLIQRMSSQGLVQRQPDSTDRRVQRVFLTERGRALEQIAARFEDEVNASAMRDFSGDERAFFLRLLQRALHNCTRMQG